MSQSQTLAHMSPHLCPSTQVWFRHCMSKTGLGTMSWAGPGRGYSGIEVLLAVTLFYCCNKAAAAGDMGAVTWLCSNKVLLTNTGRGPDGQH